MSKTRKYIRPSSFRQATGGRGVKSRQNPFTLSMGVTPKSIQIPLVGTLQSTSTQPIDAAGDATPPYSIPLHSPLTQPTVGLGDSSHSHSTPSHSPLTQPAVASMENVVPQVEPSTEATDEAPMNTNEEEDVVMDSNGRIHVIVRDGKYISMF